MEQITIFTPTYNRAFILPTLYKSLLNQTVKEFIWLIIDDGSTDETSNLVNKWIKDNLLKITYIKQDNMGMVAAHNTAHLNIKTELNVCVDSDDFMTVNAVELILTNWNKLIDRNKYLGLVGLDIYQNGDVIGDRFPENVTECSFSEISQKYKVFGDKKYVLRTDLIKSKLPYPFVEGEKFPAPSYLYLLLEKEYNFFLLNKPLCVVEYLPDGNSMNKVKQYRKSPNAFAIYRRQKMRNALSLKERFKESIHYVSCAVLAKDYNILKHSPYKLLTLAALPFGIGWGFYILNTKSNSVNKNLNKK